MGEINTQEFWLLVPEIFLAVAGMAMLLLASVGRGPANRVAGGLAFVALVVTGFLAIKAHGEAPAEPILAGLFVLDPYALFWKILVLLGTALTLALSMRYFDENTFYRPVEFYSLLLLCTTGMMLMASGFSLLTIWIALELMALASYVLAGYFKRQTKSNEAALKYFILGAVSSGVLLYGVSLLYGATGTVQLDAMARALPGAMTAQPGLVGLGWLFLAIGLLFKVAAVPFHVWTPDVYVGAPTPVTAYLAAASKGASFAILIRILYQGLPALSVDWQLVIAAISAVTMIWGNLAALTQTNVKRMLAYSSIAHAGYVLMGVLAATEEGLWAAIFYMLAYTFITFGTFGTVLLLERKEYAGETYEDYAGLSRRAPLLAFMMLVFMIALTGLPPTGGFFGKVYLFAAAIEAGWIWVAVIGVLMSAVSLYYYMGIVVNMYLKNSSEDTPVPLRAPVLVAAIALCLVATLVLGLYPGPFVEMARASLLPLP